MTGHLREAVNPARLRRYQSSVDALLKRNDDWTEVQLRDAYAVLRDARIRLDDEIQSLAGSTGSFQAHHLRLLRASVERAAQDMNQRLRALLRASVEDAWHQGDSFAPASLRAIGVAMDHAPDIDVRQLTVLQTLGVDLVTDVSTDFRHRARRTVTLGVLTGRSPHAVQADLAALLTTETKRNDTRLGSIASQAERIWRNELSNAFNVANEERHQQISTDVPGLRKWWLSAEDARVRPAHASANARYRPGGGSGPISVDEDYVVGGEQAAFPRDPRLSPGNSINCRCVSILWHADWVAPT